MDAVDLIGTLVEPLTPTLREIEELPEAVTWLQVRADLAGDISANRLRSRFGGKMLYSLRRERQGAGFQGTERERHARLLSAAREFDLVELEPEDLFPDLLSAIPAHRRLISWRGGHGPVSPLRSTPPPPRATPARSLFTHTP